MAGLDDVTRDIIRAGVIQHFEINYELFWKFMQSWLRLNLPASSADLTRRRKELFRISAREGLIEGSLPWFAYGDACNTASHIYNRDKAESVYRVGLALCRGCQVSAEPAG